MLLTDKIRRVSRPVYRLLKTDIPFQTELTASPSGNADRDAILSLFAENQGVLDENTLNKSLGKDRWKARMRTLTESGMVGRSYFIETPGPAPKKGIAVVLNADPAAIEGMDFSKSPAADTRRRTALRYLAEHGGEVFRPELMAKTAVSYDDLEYLEKRGWISLQSRDIWRDHQYYMQEAPEKPVDLTPEQTAACETIIAGLHISAYPVPVLLHGVTGSGKTEVYLRAAAEAIRLGKQVLMLVPEIALTPQILARFERRFPGKTGVHPYRAGKGCMRSGSQRGQDDRGAGRA